MKNLGESGSFSEIEEQVIEIFNLNVNAINEIHRESTTKLTYRLAWARNYLKLSELIENSSRGVWALTKNGQRTSEVEQEKVKKDREQRLKKQKVKKGDSQLEDKTERNYN